MENAPVLPRRRSRGVTIAAVLLALIVLTSLGAWQLNRLAWKEDLLASLDARAQMPAVDFAAVPQPYKDEVWRPVSLGGQWIPATGLALGPRTLDGQSGIFVFAPFRLADGRVIFVNRGWVPRLEDAEPAADGVLTGIVRLPERGRYAPANNPNENQWYWPDLDAMAKHMGFTDQNVVTKAYVQLTGTAGGAYPRTVPAVPDLRNDHLQYAIFWFGMAAVLLLFFALTQRHRRRAETQGANPAA